MTFAYTADVPRANQTIAATQFPINSNFQFIDIWAHVDHAFIDGNSSSAINGFHNKVTFPNSIATPALGAAVSALFPSTKDSTATIAFVNAGGAFSITGRNPTVVRSQGESTMPGPVYVKWGFQSAVAGDSGTITFTTPFVNTGGSTGRFVVLVTPTAPGVGITPTSDGSVFVSTGNLVANLSGFSYIVNGNASSIMNGFYWVAIGSGA